jgi:hypothetical protein
MRILTWEKTSFLVCPRERRVYDFRNHGMAKSRADTRLYGRPASQPHVECKHGDARAIGRICNNVKCVGLAFESVKNGRNILHSPSPVWLDFKPKIANHGLNVTLFQHGRGIGGIKQDCQAAETGDKLT